MKKYRFLTLLMLIPAFANASRIESTITQVTVYQQGARIEREAKVKLTQGMNEITLSYLSPLLNPQSIEAGIIGSAAIVSVNTTINNLTSPKLSDKYQRLSDSLQLLDKELTLLKSHQQGLDKQLAMLDANSKPGTGDKAPTFNDLKLWVEYFGAKQDEIRTRQVELTLQEKELQKVRKRIQEELNTLGGTVSQRVGEIECQVFAREATNITLSIAYTVSSAGWYPVYDIRTKGENTPFVIEAKANVYQRTHEEWKDARLTLSTGNFVTSNDRPKLNPWYVDIQQPTPMRAKMYDYKAAESNTLMEFAIEADTDEEEVMIPVTQQHTGLSAIYTIETKHTIPSDGQPKLVKLLDYELPARYTYHAVPKLDPSVFLLAKVTGYGSLNLLPGKTNIYYNGTYVGNTYLDPSQPTDTMLISLGKTQNISIKRTLLTDITDKQMIGGNIKETHGYKITLLNHLSETVEVEVLDQLPISQNTQIQVQADELSGAIFHAPTGGLIWNLKIAPGASTSTSFVYTLKYPKDTRITGL